MTHQRRVIIASITTVSLIALIVRPDIISTLFVIVFMGIIPGTSVTLPWWVTVSALTIALVLGIRWALDQPVYRPVATSRDLTRRATARKHVASQTARRNTRRRTPSKQVAKV